MQDKYQPIHIDEKGQKNCTSTLGTAAGRSALVGTTVGTGLGLAFSIYMMICPEDFDSWDVGYAILTCFLGPGIGAAAGAIITAPVGVAATALVCGTQSFFNHCTQRQNASDAPNDMDEENQIPVL